MKMRNGIIIIAQAALLQTSAPTIASDAGYAILRGITESIEQYNKAREEETQEQRAMENLQAMQRRRYDRSRQLQIEKWEREKAEREAQQAGEAENQPYQVTWGSGFLVAPGYVVTNAHIIQQYPYVRVRTHKGVSYKADVVVRDDGHDLALLHVALQGGGLPVIPATSIGKGESVYAIGYAALTTPSDSSNISEGVISNKYGLYEGDNWLQISTPIQEGRSGGPLLNEKGEVVGVIIYAYNTATWLKLSNSNDIPAAKDYAIKSDLLLDLLSRHGVRPARQTARRKPIDYADQNTVQVIAGNQPDA